MPAVMLLPGRAWKTRDNWNCAIELGFQTSLIDAVSSRRRGVAYWSMPA